MRSQVFAIFGLVANAFSQSDLISTLKASPDLSTLFKAVSAVPGLAHLLNSSSDITILAPTNAAFAALSPDSLEGQIAAGGNTDDLEALLSYHVLVGKYLSTAAATVPTFVHTLLNDNQIGGVDATNVSKGQNVGLIKNGPNVQIISGELAVSTVTEAVRQIS